MPRSKRDKKVSLTKVTKKGLTLKQKIVEEVRKSVSKYDHIFLFTVSNMRNAKLKDIREEWKDSRFFFGKNKVMSLALGKSKSDELEDQLYLVSKRLKGQCGLLMTNKDVKDVKQWFEAFSELDYARAGFKATRDVILPPGPLKDFAHSIEPHLRKLGLPTTLDKGIINLIKEYQVCKNGVALTPEQASILKLLGIQMAEFKLIIKGHWTKNKGFTNEGPPSDDETENVNENVDEDETMEQDASEGEE